MNVSVKKAIIGPDNGLSPVRRQTIIWNNVGSLPLEALEANLSDILIEIEKPQSRKCIKKVVCMATILLWP